MEPIGIDKKSTPKYVAQMREKGIELNRQFTNIYEDMENMKNVWTGKEYNGLMEEFNKMNDEIDKILDLVVNKIPYSLEEITQIYANADGDSTVTPQSTAITNMKTLGNTNPDRLFIDDGAVESIKGETINKLNQAKDQMEQIQSLYNQIDWEGSSANSYRSMFTTLKGQIVESFENIKASFTQFMNEALERYRNAEKATNVGQ